MVINEPPVRPGDQRQIRPDDIVDQLKSMPRLLLIGIGLFVIGLLGSSATANGFFYFLRSIGSLLILAWVLGRIPSILAKEQIIERWDTLVGGAESKGGEIITNAEELIAESRAPDVGMSHRSIAPGLIQGFMGTKRSFLVVANIANPRLKAYTMYVNARDYGANLQVSWYLAYHPSIWKKLTSLLLYVPFVSLVVLPAHLVETHGASRSELLGLDLFDEQDLRAYVTNAHHCVLEAVEKMMRECAMDLSKLNRSSRGFLGIS